MAIDDQKGSERERTDDSLREEREETDRAFAERQGVEDDADAVVRRARKNADAVVRRSRQNADAVVSEARHQADKELDQTAKYAPETAVIEARAREDETLQKERDTADERLRLQREESARALRTLLPLEREKTDRLLLTERARSDASDLNRDDFLSLASHDLEILLGGIAMSAGTISNHSPESELGIRLRIETNRIQRYTARMNRLIGDLIDVARINAGKLAVRQTRGDAAALITEASDMFQSAASEKRISLETKLIQPSLPAEFDHDRMLRVLANLITNAIKFTSRGGHIVIRGELANDDLRISVSDTGCGIPSHMLEAVFERFWQVGQNDLHGVGLGLYISRCIVEAHGGKIWAESEPEEGSTFFVTLPYSDDREHRGQMRRR